MGERNSRREEGLTTLEWLLVVAAVAGLAAVAVVGVQNVVGDTVEDVASHSARQQAAELMVSELTQRWRAAVPTSQSVERINDVFVSRCRQTGVIYADISLRTESSRGGLDSGGTGWDPALLPGCVIR